MAHGRCALHGIYAMPDSAAMPGNTSDKTTLSSFPKTIEAAFKCLKGDLNIRPIHHQVQSRAEAHIFVAFMGYALMASLQVRTRQHAAGLTPGAVLEQLAAIQMIDVHLPVHDGRCLVMGRQRKSVNTDTILKNL